MGFTRCIAEYDVDDNVILDSLLSAFLFPPLLPSLTCQ